MASTTSSGARRRLSRSCRTTAAYVEESTLPFVAQHLRPDVLLWASDYPHERSEGEFSDDIPTLLGREDVDDGLKQQILFENPTRFYRFDRQARSAEASGQQVAAR